MVVVVSCAVRPIPPSVRTTNEQRNFRAVLQMVECWDVRGDGPWMSIAMCHVHCILKWRRDLFGRADGIWCFASGTDAGDCTDRPLRRAKARRLRLF